MNMYSELTNRTESLSLVGLGYVGMPIAVAFAKKGIDVIGFDLNKAKIDLYKSGVDPTKEVGDEAIKKLPYTSRQMKRICKRLSSTLSPFRPRSIPTTRRTLPL